MTTARLTRRNPRIREARPEAAPATLRVLSTVSAISRSYGPSPIAASRANDLLARNDVESITRQPELVTIVLVDPLTGNRMTLRGKPAHFAE